MSRKRRKRNTIRQVVVNSCFIVSLLGMLILTIWLRTAIVNMEYELGKLNSKKAELVREKRLLVAKRISLHSTAMIESMATQRLGMVQPAGTNIFHVKETSSAGIYKVNMPQSKKGLKKGLVWR